MPTILAIKRIGWLLSVIFAFGAGWQIHAWKVNSALKDQMSASIVKHNAKNGESQKTAIAYTKEKQSHDDKRRETVVKVEREIVRVPVYSECVVPLDGMRILVDSANTANSLLS